MRRWGPTEELAPQRGDALNDTQPNRRVAIIVWCAIAGAFVTFAVIAAVLGPDIWPHNQQAAFLAWIAAGLAVFLVGASRVLPLRMHPATAPGSAALARTLSTSALCEAGGLFGCVAWMLTGNAWAAVAMAIGLAGLLMAFPSEVRWRELGGEGTASPAPTGEPRR